jgi:Bifunctional DNA primase/polymerase, N-terminal
LSGRLCEREIIEYAEFGFDTLPLAANSKRAIVKDWQNRDSVDLWRNAPEDSNIGLRCGGDSWLAVLDADDKNNPQTSQNLARFLAGLGFDWADYPTIATPNGGKHFYFHLDGNLPGNVRLLSPKFGAGEFRFGRGAYVGAPPSIVEGNPYRQIAGDLRSLPRIEVKDVLPILANQTAMNAAATTTSNTGITPTAPPKALELLQGNWRGKYPDRSRAEAAAVLMLVKAGFNFDTVLSLFLDCPAAGKFKAWSDKNPDTAISQYLYPTFLSAQRKTQEGRNLANVAVQWAISHVWTGRTGATDRAVYLAHCQLARQAGRIEYGASSRNLAEVAQVDHKTATKATHRLIDARLLAPVKLSDRYSELASMYRLLHHSPLSNPVGNGDLCKRTHDAFRARGHGGTFKARGLGKAAAMIFEELGKSDPLTVGEISERTGRHLSTVWRVLRRMSCIVDRDTGEILVMVSQVDSGKWRACDDVDLDRIAKALGTFGGNEWQRHKHERERAQHRERLKEGAARQAT